ncbi:hypothetical protein [Thalassomonas actiniarum]|uniref:Uncharacterized protein n=1 Tax=Thalassomonas actiniarum TaxID=485447 RepID=A0AAE9YQN0_9GAMM|nr:hypothetical protein [Thalassomonas actiniarum]WDD99285.1 hypothetical protein SG35_000930 [Thalassomonas actiniarum]
MAKSNDMSEFHSVKVSLTENIPDHQYPPTNHHNRARHSLPLTIKGGRYHV